MTAATIGIGAGELRRAWLAPGRLTGLAWQTYDRRRTRTPAARMAANTGTPAPADELARRGPADHSPSRMRAQRGRSARHRTAGRPRLLVGLAVPATSFMLTAAAFGFVAFGVFAIPQSRYRRM